MNSEDISHVVALWADWFGVQFSAEAGEALVDKLVEAQAKQEQEQEQERGLAKKREAEWLNHIAQYHKNFL